MGDVVEDVVYERGVVFVFEERRVGGTRIRHGRVGDGERENVLEGVDEFCYGADGFPQVSDCLLKDIGAMK